MAKDPAKFDLLVKTYWRYYTELENEMLATSQYVDFSQGNFNTYSVEFMKLYQAVCSEIDVFGKALASEMNVSFKPDDTSVSVHKWWFEIQSWYKTLTKKTVVFCQEYQLTPWENYQTEWVRNKKGALYCRVCQMPNIKTPSWWSEYNGVKHHRTSKDNSGKLNYEKANLQNLSNAFAALYILESNYLHELGDAVQIQSMKKSALFEKDESIFVVDDDGCLCITCEDEEIEEIKK